MKKNILIFTIFLSLLTFALSSAKTNDTSTKNSNQTSTQNLSSKIDIIRDGLKEVRRDQLNYKIEKNILKETYSSNLQTINILIAIILGVFTVIGLLGVKSISSIKTDFIKELDKIKEMRSMYSLKFEEITREQAKTKEEYIKLKTYTENQEQRIKVLEVQEKASAFILQNNFRRALLYISIGLEIDDKDSILLRQKMRCHMGLRQYNEAAKTGNIIIENDSDSLPTVANLCEVYLLSSNIPEYEKLFENNKIALSEKYSTYLIWYFEAIVLSLNNDLEGYKKHLTKLQTEFKPNGKYGRINGWGFAEIKMEMQALKNGELKTLFGKSIAFLEGSLEIEAVIKEQEKSVDHA